MKILNILALFIGGTQLVPNTMAFTWSSTQSLGYNQVQSFSCTHLSDQSEGGITSGFENIDKFKLKIELNLANAYFSDGETIQWPLESSTNGASLFRYGTPGNSHSLSIPQGFMQSQNGGQIEVGAWSSYRGASSTFNCIRESTGRDTGTEIIENLIHTTEPLPVSKCNPINYGCCPDGHGGGVQC